MNQTFGNLLTTSLADYGIARVAPTTALEAIRQFIEQRPGFEFANYGDAASYRADYRRALRDLHDARVLLRFCELSPSIDVVNPRLWHRLTLTLTEDGYRADYCTGQYFPTEYRAAACGLLSSAIWVWLRDEVGFKTGDAIRNAAKRQFGPAIARRWFR